MTELSVSLAVHKTEQMPSVFIRNRRLQWLFNKSCFLTLYACRLNFFFFSSIHICASVYKNTKVKPEQVFDPEIGTHLSYTLTFVTTLR